MSPNRPDLPPFLRATLKRWEGMGIYEAKFAHKRRTRAVYRTLILRLIPYSTKFSPDKNFAEFIFAHRARCSPERSGWSHRMNTPCSTAQMHLAYDPRCLVLACCTLFTAALASVMAEGDSPDDRGPAGSGFARGTTL